MVLLWEEGPMPLIQPDLDTVIQDHLIIPNAIGNLLAVEISLSPWEHLGDGAGPPEMSMKMSVGAEGPTTPLRQVTSLQQDLPRPRHWS